MFKFMAKEYFVKAIPDQFEALQTAMKAMDASKPVVILSESMSLGSLPSMLGVGIQPTARLDWSRSIIRLKYRYCAIRNRATTGQYA
jgi:hypothetical protein